MELKNYQVYALKSLGRNSFQGYLQENGQKIVLKPAEHYVDQKVVCLLHALIMPGLPHIIGTAQYQDKRWIIQNWLEGESLFAKVHSGPEVESFLDQLLSLIDHLESISGLNWFFMDLKTEHLLLNPYHQICLIDFEHVVLSTKTSVPWQELAQIGVTPGYCSPAIRSDFLTKKHQNYALAMIGLSLLSGKQVSELDQSTKEAALAELSSGWQERFRNAMLTCGFQNEPDQNQPALGDDLSLEAEIPRLKVKAEQMRKGKPDLIIEKAGEKIENPYTINIYLP